MMQTCRTLRATQVVAIAAVLISLAGCVPIFGTAEGGPSQSVADAIRGSGSDLIDHVDYISANFLDPARVNVYLKPGSTEAQADAFWCSVVIAAAGAGKATATGSTLQMNGLRPIRADAAAGVSLWNRDGTDTLGSGNPQC